MGRQHVSLPRLHTDAPEPLLIDDSGVRAVRRAAEQVGAVLGGHAEWADDPVEREERGGQRD